MQNLRQYWLLATLGLACGGKDGSTAGSASSDTGAPASSTTDATAAATTGLPTTGPASTGDATSSGSTGGESSTGEAPNCETSSDDCGVTVSDESSVCPEPPPDKDELKLEVLGPGKIKVTEVGRDSACNVTIGSVVSLAPHRELYVTYEVFGQPDNSCICKFDVTSTISGLTPGLWTVYVGSYEGKVEVP